MRQEKIKNKKKECAHHTTVLLPRLRLAVQTRNYVSGSQFRIRMSVGVRAPHHHSPIAEASPRNANQRLSLTIAGQN